MIQIIVEISTHEKLPLSPGHPLISLSNGALEQISERHLEYYTNWC